MVFPKVSLDPDEDSEEKSALNKRAMLNPKVSDISREQFLEDLMEAIERMGSRTKVAEALGVPKRYIFRWQKGDGPTAAAMAELDDKLQTMEPD